MAFCWNVKIEIRRTVNQDRYQRPAAGALVETELISWAPFTPSAGGLRCPHAMVPEVLKGRVLSNHQFRLKYYLLEMSVWRLDPLQQ